MLTDTQKRLERLKNYNTRYEVVAVGASGERVLVMYTARKSRRGMLDALCKQAAGVMALTGSDGITSAKRAADGFIGGNGWRFVWGRTQRDAIVEGELPWIGDIAAAA